MIISDSGLVADTGATLRGRFAPCHNVRLNAAMGVRSVRFMAVRGFDALAAVQDVATGVQFGAVFGRGVPRFGAGDDDLFLSTDVYAGLGSARSFAALRVTGEGRYDRTTHRWDSLVGSGQLAWYFKPSAAHVVIVSGEFSGGWRERLPLQLRR